MTDFSISPRLARFVAEVPGERQAILEFLMRAARATTAGRRVLDAGAGDAPYGELFAHCEYCTSDWEASPHAGGRSADVVAPLDDLPLEDESFDVVICTQVLEHVPRPAAVLDELRRVLAPGGTLYLTAPFVGQLHEEPYDFFRYTKHGLRSLVETAGFKEVEVEALGGYFSSLALLLHAAGLSIGVERTWRDLPRRALAALLRAVGVALPKLDGLDRRRALPSGYSCTARRSRG